MFSATARLVTQRSIACFSMKRCASFSVMRSCSISRHFARFTTRMSYIFSSMEAVFSSIRRSLYRVAHSSVSDWVMICGVVGLDTASTPKGETRALISG